MLNSEQKDTLYGLAELTYKRVWHPINNAFMRSFREDAFSAFKKGEYSKIPAEKAEEAANEYISILKKFNIGEYTPLSQKNKKRLYGYKAELDNRDGNFFTVATTTSLSRDDFYAALSKEYDMEQIRVAACYSKSEMEE